MNVIEFPSKPKRLVHDLVKEFMENIPEEETEGKIVLIYMHEDSVYMTGNGSLADMNFLMDYGKSLIIESIHFDDTGDGEGGDDFA